MTNSDIIISACLTIAGYLLSEITNSQKAKLRFSRELKENNYIDLSGDDWIAVWQTSVNGNEVLNTERIIIKQKGGLIKIWNQEKSLENPIAGYMWEGQLQFYHGRDLMGHYFSKRDEQNTNKGIMFFNYNSAKREFLGRWVGASYDGPLSSGFCVISKSREKSMELLNQVLKAHPDKVPILSQII